MLALEANINEAEVKTRGKDWRKPSEKETRDFFKQLLLHETGHLSHYLADKDDFTGDAMREAFYEERTPEEYETLSDEEKEVWQREKGKMEGKHSKYLETIAFILQFAGKDWYESLTQLRRHPDAWDWYKHNVDHRAMSLDDAVDTVAAKLGIKRDKSIADKGSRSKNYTNKIIRALVSIDLQNLLDYVDRHATSKEDKNYLIKLEMKFRRFMGENKDRYPMRVRNQDTYSTVLDRYNEEKHYGDDPEVNINPATITPEFQSEKREFIDRLFKPKFAKPTYQKTGRKKFKGKRRLKPSERKKKKEGSDGGS